MSDRMKRLIGASLSLGILLSAHGANAQSSAKAMLEQAVSLLASAERTLQQDSVSPGDKQRALGQIHEAAEILMHVPVN